MMRDPQTQLSLDHRLSEAVAIEANGLSTLAPAQLGRDTRELPGSAHSQIGIIAVVVE